MPAEQVNECMIMELLLTALSEEILTALYLGTYVICLRMLLKKNKSSIKRSYLTQWMYIPCSQAGYKLGYSNSRSCSLPQITGPVPLRTDQEAGPML